jgi:hypothetical protein
MGLRASAFLVSLSVSCAVAGFLCSESWPDICPAPAIAVGSTSGCTPYADPLPVNTNWTTVRGQLRNSIFGRTDGLLPPGDRPDFLVQIGGNTSRGCWCSTLSNCDSTQCQWDSNMTQLVFTISAAVNSTYNLTLNSTVFWTLNTSGVAPINYGPDEVEYPQLLIPPSRLSDTLVIFHNGHNSPCNISDGDPDYDGTVDWLNQLGYDVFNMHMPLYQVNQVPFAPCDHSWFEQWEAQRVPVFRYFLEPVIRAINYATSVLGYSRIVMAGLSGGGWTTAVSAALDPRIQLSLPVAGSMPCDFAHTSWDFEQYCNSSWAMVANYTSLYVLAGLEEDRTSVQIIHEQDPCCFHGCGRHDRIREYNAFVHSQIGGQFVTAATVGNAHEVNFRDKVIIASLLDNLRIQGNLSASQVEYLPFNTLREW